MSCLTRCQHENRMQCALCCTTRLSSARQEVASDRETPTLCERPVRSPEAGDRPGASPHSHFCSSSSSAANAWNSLNSDQHLCCLCLNLESFMWLQVMARLHNPLEVLRYCGPSSACECLRLPPGKAIVLLKEKPAFAGY